MTVLHADFETRSTLDLQEVGLDNYASHPSTDILCMAFAFDDSLVDTWAPGIEPLPQIVHEHVYNGGEFVAHNAAFELAIWNNIVRKRYGGPTLLPSSCTCTMAMAYSMALPGALDAAAAAVGLPIGKDDAGRRLMLQMCRPRTTSPVTWWDSPEKLVRLYAYCRNDVEVERQLHKRLMPLSPKEKRIWQLDYKINNRGIRIDTEAVKSAIKVVEFEQDRLNADLKKITQGVVGSVTEVASLTKWIRMKGVAVPGLAKSDVIQALTDENIPDDVRQALLIRQEAGRASTAKLNKMLSAVSTDGRLRNTLQYHGAATGRWAGRLVQVHNLPRPTIHNDDILEYAFEAISKAETPAEAAQIIELTIGSPSEVLVSMLRGMFVPGTANLISAGDFANIEGRALAWEAGEAWKLDAFRAYDAGTGPDLYKLTYSRSFGVPLAEVTGDQRQVGKVAELACGYQGGVGAFQTMAKAYNVKISDTKAEEVKTAWRAAHPATVQFWWDLERAAIDATINPGQKMTVQSIQFLRKGSFLMCKLPSGKVLFYPYPEIRSIIAPWGDEKEALTYKTVPSQNTKLVDDPTNMSRWARVSTYGGKLAENITQAIACDLLAEALLRLDEAGMDVVLHVHDEAVCEIGDASATAAIESIMKVTPPWAAGLPIAVKAWAGKRYKKD